ncbi:MAG: hypothetical protein Q9P01_01840 [Anaerolineae bacterium]|nr:hypothetical protein [Anaerolineae bacterium]MDQ7033602.1 hypothetical protein [Anaerolineae bacterium]
MFEAALLILVTTGSLWFLSQRLKLESAQAIPVNTEESDEKVVSSIAVGGLYSITQAGDSAAYGAFSDLQLTHDGLTLRDNGDGQARLFRFALIQWVTAVTVADDGTAQIVIHIEASQQWRLLHLRLAQSDMVFLTNVLQRILPAARLNIDRPISKPIGLISARMVEENLQGEITVGQAVDLYLLPHMLIVLHDDKVQAKLDTSSFRRVLAVERVSGKLDNILHPNKPDGLVRIYSLYETAVFALPQYRQLAEELSYLSRCPVEFIVQDDKTHKT